LQIEPVVRLRSIFGTNLQTSLYSFEP
jgi:hypothetical protein